MHLEKDRSSGTQVFWVVTCKRRSDKYLILARTTAGHNRKIPLNLRRAATHFRTGTLDQKPSPPSNNCKDSTEGKGWCQMAMLSPQRKRAKLKNREVSKEKLL